MIKTILTPDDVSILTEAIVLAESYVESYTMEYARKCGFDVRSCIEDCSTLGVLRRAGNILHDRATMESVGAS